MLPDRLPKRKVHGLFSEGGAGFPDITDGCLFSIRLQPGFPTMPQYVNHYRL
jgi:hypothetical protein